MTGSSSIDQLAEDFARQRPRLHAIARRVLGSSFAADDAVQEAWVRLQRANGADIRNLEAWLTTVVSRVSIDLIRQRASWREDAELDEVTDAADSATTPDESVQLREDLALALEVVLDALAPLERLSFVLHDVFGMPFEEVAPILERTPANARQLASRARARLRRVDVTEVRRLQSAAVDDFLTAAREGDFGRLLQLLDPEVELRADHGAVALATSGSAYGAPLLEGRIRGADAVARVFAGRAALAYVALIDGVPSLVYAADGSVQAAYLIRFREGVIEALDVIADRSVLTSLDVTA
ncbi:sigma-70 family RNA polymerase sigma factor [Ruania halotolerans]|uniref:sigma-70 family RNA polymerase sigma factor n=1 Tax=Ruania halotolerans TaxID=2897773 RepID=UPI001E519C9A|nr:sigma-70 family RNA polymerase sigma factor [Ruania halotolerans]UFU06865.1 sigma-70 family RNA polymerase sigma factor [Ruania halotolerans]